MIDTGAARWWREASGVVCNQSYVEQVTAAHIRDGLLAVQELAEGRKVALVAESGPLSGTSREARDELAGPEAAAVFSSMAVVVRSPVASAIMNFFMRFSSPPFPVRVFASPVEARTWAARHGRNV